MRDRHPTRTAVLAFLANGPAHRELIEQALGRKLQATMYEMRQRRLIHVHGWLRGTGNMRALRMVYGLGDLPDAPRLPPDKEKFRRYYYNHKAKIAEKRRINGYKYTKKAAAAQRRLRAKNRLKSNPFIQLNPELFRDLKRRATSNAKHPKSGKGVPAQPTRRYTTEDTRAGGGVGRTWTGVRQTESGELASAPPDQQAG